MFEHLPGGEILEDGLRDLADGRKSRATLLLMIAGPRLRGHGFAIPTPPPGSRSCEEILYLDLCEEHGRDAYPRYNALIQRLVSLENALDATRRPISTPQN